MRVIIFFLIQSGVLMVLLNSGYLPGVTTQNGFTSLLIFSVMLAIVNLILGTLLRILTFPLRLLTLWLFSFVIALVIVWVTDQLVPVVSIDRIESLCILTFVTGTLSILYKIIK